MSKRNVELLQQSIEHWKRMRDDPDCGERPGPWDCPLCNEYRGFMSECKDCPVRLATGWFCCQKTPYRKASLRFIDWTRRPHRRATDDLMLAAWRKAADVEIRFLTKLLKAELVKADAGKPVEGYK